MQPVVESLVRKPTLADAPGIQRLIRHYAQRQFLLPRTLGQVCEDLRDMCRDVDAAFLCNCGLDGSDHRELAEPFIKKGIPTFIDKPLALEAKDASAMVKLARRYKTPIYSTSLLAVVDQVDTLRRQFNRIGNVTRGTVSGAPGWRTKSGAPVKNRALWEALLQAAQRHRVAWYTDKGSDIPSRDLDEVKRIANREAAPG